VGHRPAEQHPVALLGLSQSGAANPGGAVVQHPGRADLRSAVPSAGVANPHTHAADPDSWADCNPWASSADPRPWSVSLLSLGSMGADLVGYRLVLWHNGSERDVCESQYHEPEPDLRRHDVVHSVELRFPQNSSNATSAAWKPMRRWPFRAIIPRSAHWSVTQLKPTKAVFCVTLTVDQHGGPCSTDWGEPSTLFGRSGVNENYFTLHVRYCRIGAGCHFCVAGLGQPSSVCGSFPKST